MIVRQHALSMAALFVCMGVSVPALAETEGERLFKEGRSLLASGKVDEACDRFRKSYDLEKATGSLLNLANCEEERLKLLEAKRLWQKASEAADTDESRKYADGRLKTVSGRIPTVVLSTIESGEGIRILLDGNEVRQGSVTAIDPGPHVAAVTTTGGRKERNFDAQPGERLRFELGIPGGREPPPDPIRTPPNTTPPTEGTNWAIPGWISMGIGAAGLAVFAGTGAAVLAECPDAVCPDGKPDGLLITNLVSVIVGGTGVGLGSIFLIVDATSDSPGTTAAADPPVAFSPWFGANAGGVVISGSF